nr:TonB-dependent receptor plug domain-containing protein [uncultured Campylobacter sp.]
MDDIKINTRNATLVKDVFRDIPGVYVGGTNGMNQKIYMRGVSDRGLNIMIDGAKQNGNTFHHNADLLINPDLIKAVEVDVGARSVVNGSGALGGSVAFRTVRISAPSSKWAIRAITKAIRKVRCSTAERLIA